MDSSSPVRSPRPLGRTSESSMNVAAPVSPFKRRKVEVNPPISRNLHSSTIPKDKYTDLYTKSHIPGRQAKVQHLAQLRKLAEQRHQQMTQLNTQIMTLKTRKHNLEFENFKMDDEYLELKTQASTLNDQIEELNFHEKQSLEELQQKLELSTKSLNLNHEKQVQLLKENATKEIETHISKAQQRNIDIKNKLKSECESLSTRLNSQKKSLDSEINKLREEHKRKFVQLDKNMDETLDGAAHDIQELNDRTSSVSSRIEQVSVQEVKPLQKKLVELQRKESTLKEAFGSKQQEVNALTNRIETMRAKISNLQHSTDTKKREIELKNNLCIQMNGELTQLEKQRRVLHNTVQELRGKIRVFCRVRPPTSEDENLSLIHYPSLDELDMNALEELTISKESSDSTDYGQGHTLQTKSYAFGFDKIFAPTSGNPEIFEEICQLIQSSLDGFNVCVFAYGQTGSGKTWTMSHPGDGMIPLSMTKIFQDIQELKQTGWEYKVQGQFLEIYNDNIIDLLGNSTGLKYEIKHDDVHGTTTVSNLSSVVFESAEHAQSLFEVAARNRSTASTACNERSSRSHSICIVRLEGFNTNTKQKSVGYLNLVDLAGSERWSKSQVQGDRLKEMQHINRSLSSLGEVIYSLGNTQKGGNGHVSYRNSKLTYLLKHSLGGNSKTLMFVNISPSLSNFNETINSLRFAQKVTTVKQGNGSKNK